nr:unnamed protein product [Callosobruchus analis]
MTKLAEDPDTRVEVVKKALFDLCPNIVNWTWNYTEAGHGKGAPDGVGAVCKRTADNIVACGRDIADINEFCSAVQDRCPNIKLFAVSDNEIDNMSLLISENQPNLVSFSGTLKVHQVQGNVFLPRKLIMKNLSCFCDNNGCEHYRLGVLKYDRQSRTTVDAGYGNSDSEQSEPGSASINIENEKSKDVKAQEIRNGIPTKKSEKTGSKATKVKRVVRNRKESDDCPCLICGALYNEDTTGEDWIQCILCHQWAQIGCIKSNPTSFTCPDCLFDYK